MDYMNPPCGLMPLGMHGPFRWLCIRKGRLITVATRGTYFDRPEVELRYRIIGTDDFTLGLTGGFRNYSYHFKDEDGAKAGSANMQRYKIQPDWDVKLTDDWRFGGWFAMYQFANDRQNRLF